LASGTFYGHADTDEMNGSFDTAQDTFDFSFQDAFDTPLVSGACSDAPST